MQHVTQILAGTNVYYISNALWKCTQNVSFNIISMRGHVGTSVKQFGLQPTRGFCQWAKNIHYTG